MLALMHGASQFAHGTLAVILAATCCLVRSDVFPKHDLNQHPNGILQLGGPQLSQQHPPKMYSSAARCLFVVMSHQAKLDLAGVIEMPLLSQALRLLKA